MKLVIDANIIFACLLQQSKTHELIFNENLQLYTPEFFFEELEKHHDEILRKTKRTEHEYKELCTILKKKITLIQLEEVVATLDDAQKISPDPKDVAYVALALKLHCPLWSNDKKLKEQKNVRIITTEELMRNLY